MIATTISKSNMQIKMVARLLKIQENIIHRFLSLSMRAYISMHG